MITTTIRSIAIIANRRNNEILPLLLWEFFVISHRKHAYESISASWEGV